jgi:hypothetical protein
MTFFWHQILGFVAAFLFGTVFFDVFLRMYERGKKVAGRATEQRIFRWSIKGGIGIGILTVILQFLFSN